MNILEYKNELYRLLAKHTKLRGECLNLIASENAMSNEVKALLSSDLNERYGDYLGRDLTARKYLGNNYIAKIEQLVVELISQLFNAGFVETRPLSGHVAGSAVIMAITEPGDTVLELGPDGGGHRLAQKLVDGTGIPINVEFLPFDPLSYNIDTEGACKQIRRLKPKLVILGSSNFLFPHPVSAIAETLKTVRNAVLAYDASHVLGLIAGKKFQNPLEEGADIVFASTHKTFPGPQGGVIFSDSEELMTIVSKAIYPGLVTNHHLARIPALAITSLEMLKWGSKYAHAIISNSQTFAKEIETCGVQVVGSRCGYTKSHTVLLNVGKYGSGRELSDLLEKAGIIVTPAKLPVELGGEGLRIGLQEVTRWGANKEDMSYIAGLMSEVLQKKRDVKKVRESVRKYSLALYSNLQYTLSDAQGEGR